MCDVCHTLSVSNEGKSEMLFGIKMEFFNLQVQQKKSHNETYNIWISLK